MERLRHWWLANWRDISIWWVAILAAVIIVGGIKLAQYVFGFSNAVAGVVSYACIYACIALLVALPLLVRYKGWIPPKDRGRPEP